MGIRMTLFLLLAFHGTLLVHGLRSMGLSLVEGSRGRCERITIPMCQGMPYNLTSMPNYLGHQEQSEAAIEVHQFMPLVEFGCSKHLPFFLCSLYAPMCSEQVDVPIPSCRGLCEEVKAACLPVLAEFSFSWPQGLNCSRLPVPEKNGLCMEFPNITEERTRMMTQAPRHHEGLEGESSSAGASDEADGPSSPWSEDIFPRAPEDSEHPACPPRFAYVSYSKPHGVCAPRCGADVYFTSSDKAFAEVWMGVWASLCFISTLFTMLTFGLEPSRFHYPERPVVALAFCYNVCSVAYLVRVAVGAGAISCATTDAGHQHAHLAVEGLPTTGCVLVFLVLYYFGLAASVWWVVLALAWYLSAARQWSSEALQARSPYFHLVSWASPALLTIGALARRHVSGEELTGLCVVGGASREALLTFAILPNLACFVAGVACTALALSALLRVRRHVRRDARDANKLERLLIRLALFAALYALPTACVLAAQLYEYLGRPRWHTLAHVSALDCQSSSQEACPLRSSIPSTEVFMLRLFMTLAVGITSGMWVWSAKTGRAWQRCLLAGGRGVSCLCCCCWGMVRAPRKAPPQPPLPLPHTHLPPSIHYSLAPLHAAGSHSRANISHL